MKPLDIRIALLRKGLNSRLIARDCAVTDSTVSNVIHGRARSRHVATRISDLTGIPVAKLWPGKYPALELAEIRAAA